MSRTTRGRRGRGQAMIEFALVLPLFLVALFGCIDAALWTMELGTATSAADQAVRVAAAAAGSPTSTQPALDAAEGGVAEQRLRSSLFATTVQRWCTAETGPCVRPASGGCPTDPNVVRSTLGSRVVVLCAQRISNPQGDPMVEMRVIGYMASLVPPAAGVWHAAEIPVNVGARTHALTFAP